MTRPAVVIGLGGTGQWILTYLKKDLLELNNGEMPKNVRLLAFDTVTSAEASKLDAGGQYTAEQARYEREAKRIGSIELDPKTELIHIGGDCYPLAEAIEKGRYPHLNWFDVKYWKYEAGLGRDNWILDRGAGRFRQFGLLAVYKDLLGGDEPSKILTFLPAAIRDVKAAVEGNSSFEIILVGSVAGGTGSAMIIPFGVLAKHMFGEELVRSRSIIVLPSAFSPGKRSTELELRGGAALRELARAMMPPTGYSSTMNFLPNSPYSNVPFERPFDGVYFVDGTRNKQPINKDPKFGVFPAVSGWIRQILDEESGEWFTNYVATNLKGSNVTDTTRQAEGVFGVFGVKSYYIPVRSQRQTYRLKLANQVLGQITDPVQQPTGQLVANNQPLGAPEPGGQAYRILAQNVEHQGSQVMVTTYMNEVARIVQAGGKGNKDEVNNKAQAGWYAKRDVDRTMYSWDAPFTTLPESNQFDELRSQIAVERTESFARGFQPSDQTKPPRDPGSQVSHNVLDQGIKDFMHTHYGGMGANGPEDFGEFGAVTRQVAQAQVDTFKAALRLNVLRLLSEDQGRGRIGYTITVLKRLDGIFAQFEDFMKEVENARGQLAPQAKLVSDVSTTSQAWEARRKKQPTLMEKLQKKYSEEALKSERNYITAYHILSNYVRELTLHNAAKAAAREMQAYTRKTVRQLELWEATLLEGDVARGVTGLYTTTEKNLAQVQAAITEDQRSNEIEELVAVTSREAEIQQADLDWAYAGVQWVADPTDDGLAFHLSLKPEAVRQGEMVAVREGMNDKERRGVERSNLTALEGVMEQRFGQARQVTEILVYLRANKSPEDLADEITGQVLPLTELTLGIGQTLDATCVSVKKDEDTTGYAQEVEKKMRKNITGSENADNNRPVQVIGSEDPYRLTAVRTRVGLMLHEFATWERCQGTYETELDRVQPRQPGTAAGGEGLMIEANKKLMKALQAQYTQREEKAAVAIEVRWREEGYEHRVLNPRIVSLIGEPRKLRLALQAFAMGWVKEVEDKDASGYYHWQLDVPGWDFDYWVTPNSENKGDRDEFEALLALVLWETNHARGRSGTKLSWEALETALAEQKKISDGSAESPLKAAVGKALCPEGLVKHWLKIAGEHVDQQTQKLTYDNPAYHDLADYAQRYYRSMEW